jgi:hypothetical protein
MRWLLILSLLFTLGCATVKASPEQPAFIPYVVIKQQGWVSFNKEGTLWFLMAKRYGHLYRIGSCQQKYQNLWYGKYYAHGTDLFGEEKFLVDESSTLSECVEWVEHHALGDFYL